MFLRVIVPLRSCSSSLCLVENLKTSSPAIPVLLSTTIQSFFVVASQEYGEVTPTSYSAGSNSTSILCCASSIFGTKPSCQTSILLFMSYWLLVIEINALRSDVFLFSSTITNKPSSFCSTVSHDARSATSHSKFAVISTACSPPLQPKVKSFGEIVISGTNGTPPLSSSMLSPPSQAVKIIPTAANKRKIFFIIVCIKKLNKSVCTIMTKRKCGVILLI